jgi:predicted lactoylglutathione lyase
MPATPRLVFINLPVADVAASKAFFGELGFEFDEKFTNESCACLVINDQAYAMLLSETSFAGFATQPSPTPARRPRSSCASRPTAARASTPWPTARWAPARRRRATRSTTGFMYGRSFKDLDGHHWEVMWMSQEAVEQGPADMAQPA